MKNRILGVWIIIVHSVLLVICGYIIGADWGSTDKIEVTIKIEAQDLIESGDLYINTPSANNAGGFEWY